MKVSPQHGDNLPIRPQNQQVSRLATGQTLRVLVEGLRGTVATVRAGALRFTARLEGDVAPGRWYRVEVMRSGRTIVLKTLSREPAPVDTAALARTHGLPSGDAEAVVRAFVRTGLPLQSDRLALAWSRVRSSGRLSLAERARLAAILEDKGLLHSQAVWERALEAVAGRDSGDQDGDGSRGGTRERSENRRDEEAGEEAEAPTVAVGEVIAGFAASQHADDPLQLINHRSGREGDWIVIPLEFDGADELRAVLKIRFGDDGDRPVGSFREAVLDVSTGGDRWSFAVLPAAGRVRVLALSCPPGDGSLDALADETLAPLGRRLSGLGIGFSVRPLSGDSNDGFSTHEDPVILRSVDSRA